MELILGFFLYLFTLPYVYEPCLPPPPPPEPAHIVVAGNVAAYTSAADECGKDDGITTYGTVARSGIVANDVLPFGTIVLINGKEYTVEDTFGGVYDVDRFDVYFDTKAQAFEFGRQHIDVEILYIP